MIYFSRNASNISPTYKYRCKSSRSCQFYDVTCILFDLFYSVAFDGIDIRHNAYKNELKSRSFDLAAGRIDCTVIQYIESESEKLRGLLLERVPVDEDMTTTPRNLMTQRM